MSAGVVELDDNAFNEAFDQAWAVYSEDLKILMDYKDGVGFQETDEDDCIRRLLAIAIEAYIRALAKSG